MEQHTYGPFRNEFAATIFRQKYSQDGRHTWESLADCLVDDVCGSRSGTESPLLSGPDSDELARQIKAFRFIPGGRYLYYAGRPAKYFNNCYLLRAEDDTREEWSNLTWRAMSCLMTGGGIGIDYSRLREAGRVLGRTGGIASGPIPLMHAINEIGRNVMQGGSRRSAIYASLSREHPDVFQFLKAKNWHDQQAIEGLSIAEIKQRNPYFHAPLESTNISVNYDDRWLSQPDRHLDPVFLENCKQALMTGEPGFSFNFGAKSNETLRNACTEVTSEDDSDVCNLGSINLGAVETLDEFRGLVEQATKFLVCGTLRAHLPYEKVHSVRNKNRRLGLGLMGIHEWLLKRGSGYEVTPELHEWLKVYRDTSKSTADNYCDQLGISRPVAYRAIAPTGSIGILAGTTTGIEPLFAVAYKRRYLKGNKWRYQFVVDGVADLLINKYGINPDSIETARNLSDDFERRIAFQASVQDYVDMSISSTINLPGWTVGESDSSGRVNAFAEILSRYAPRLRGFTCYPDGCRGGQPLTTVSYEDAMKHKDKVFEEVDICDITGHGGTCGA